MTVPTFELKRRKTHRLIASNHSQPAMHDLFDDDIEAGLVFALEGATSQRLAAQSSTTANRLGQIDPLELIGGIPNAHVVNAAFCYPSPTGARFNTNQRGAWYSAFELETCIAEVSFHHWRFMQEAGFDTDTITKDDWTASFEGEFHDLRQVPDHPSLGTDIDTSYPIGQGLATALIEGGSFGIIYPSARHTAGTNLVCFRPPLVQSPTKGQTLTFVWNGDPTPTIS